MDPKDQKRDDTPTHLFNPLKDVVKIGIRNDENEQETVEIPSLEVSTYPKWLADVLKKHLVDAIMNSRGLGFLTPEDRKEIEDEVEVVI